MLHTKGTRAMKAPRQAPCTWCSGTSKQNRGPPAACRCRSCSPWGLSITRSRACGPSCRWQSTSMQTPQFTKVDKVAACACDHHSCSQHTNMHQNAAHWSSIVHPSCIPLPRAGKMAGWSWGRFWNPGRLQGPCCRMSRLYSRYQQSRAHSQRPWHSAQTLCLRST